MARYAEETTVSPEKSRAEIERTLARYGADAFCYAQDASKSVLGFRAHGRFVRFTLMLPDPQAEEFVYTTVRGYPRKRSPAQARAAWEQAVRQRWRALALGIKAKLELVESGVSVFEQEFLANTVLPGGETVGARVGPLVDEAIRTGEAPKLLPFTGTGG